MKKMIICVKALIFLFFAGVFCHIRAEGMWRITTFGFIFLDGVALLILHLLFWREIQNNVIQEWNEKYRQTDEPIPVFPFFRQMKWPLCLLTVSLIAALFKHAEFWQTMGGSIIAVVILIAIYQSQMQGYFNLNTGVYKKNTFRYKLSCAICWFLYFLMILVPFLGFK